MKKTILSNRFAQWLLPIILVSPVIGVGQYGIRISEVIIALTSFYVLYYIVAVNRIERVIFIFLSLFMMSWLLSLVNGYFGYGISVGVPQLSFVYRMLFYLSAFYIGYHYRGDIKSLLDTKQLRIALYFVALLSIIYVALQPDQRFKMLSFFWAEKDELAARVGSYRFPGLGSNINIFSFVPAVIFLFSFAEFVRARGSVIVPLMSLISLFLGGSRKSIILIFISFVTIGYFERKLSQNKGSRHVLLGLLLIMISAYVIFMYSSKIDMVSHFESAFTLDVKNQGSSALGRLIAMARGLERVALEPLWGIPNVQEGPFSEVILFGHPHNEFIQIWMFYGIIAAVACLLLIIGMGIKNIRSTHHDKILWFLFYMTAFTHFIVDTAFMDYQWSSIFFLFMGINIRMLNSPEVESAKGG